VCVWGGGGNNVSKVEWKGESTWQGVQGR
jgi:hypothetical protein